ncbi:MAG: dipeptide ABC transporter ATP-binding protein [Alphaproteobacteria bacterium]|nr:dipeptide ABC transporter ATP-binding protein [Alphaproteobacteria bacterium]
MTAGMAQTGPLVAVRGLRKHYDLRRGLRRFTEDARAHTVHALDGVSFDIARGETLGVIGESGCGKSTLGRTVLRLLEPTAGTVSFDGADLAGLDAAAMKALRRRMQIVFQDPYASLNPRRTVEQIVGLGLAIHARPSPTRLRELVAEMLGRVGLSPAHMQRYPHQFSGGQRQRIGIARALIVEPDFVVCDEPVSALDVSIQAQILALLEELKRAFDLTYLFISHDLAVVGHISDRIAVMYLGQIVELGPARRLLQTPAHPYTQALLEAVPRVDAEAQDHRPLGGDVPSPLKPPPGCRFHTRCPHATAQCRSIAPEHRTVAPGHHVACHLYEGGPA